MVQADWIKIKKGKRTNPLQSFKPSFYHNLSHDYATKPEFAADPLSSPPNNTTTPPPLPSKFKFKAQRCAEARRLKRNIRNDEDKISG